MLLGQLWCVEQIQREVDSTFFLVRAVAYATFMFHGDQTQLALAIDSLPASAFRHSERVAVTLLVVGCLLLAAIPWIRPLPRRRR